MVEISASLHRFPYNCVIFVKSHNRAFPLPAQLLCHRKHGVVEKPSPVLLAKSLTFFFRWAYHPADSSRPSHHTAKYIRNVSILGVALDPSPCWILPCALPFPDSSWFQHWGKNTSLISSCHNNKLFPRTTETTMLPELPWHNNYCRVFFKPVDQSVFIPVKELCVEFRPPIGPVAGPAKLQSIPKTDGIAAFTVIFSLRCYRCTSCNENHPITTITELL